jgi:hypothetical protein
LERLGDKSVSAAFVRSTSGFFLGVGGKDDNGKLAGGGLRADGVKNLPAIHAGESDIEHDQVGRFGGHGFEPSGAILTGDDLDVACSQANLDKAANDRRIFNNQDSVTHFLQCLSG